MGNDVERIVVGNERTDIQSGNIFNAVFIFYLLRETLVSTHSVAELLYSTQKIGMRSPELSPAFLVAGVKNCSVGENHLGRNEQPVAVGMYSTVHSRCVVGHYAANHCSSHRCRIGPEHTAVGLQQMVDFSADESRLQCDNAAVSAEVVFPPVLSGHDKHRIAERLTRKGGAGGAECVRNMIVGAGGHYPRDVDCIPGADNHTGHNTVKTGIGSPGQCA